MCQIRGFPLHFSFGMLTRVAFSDLGVFRFRKSRRFRGLGPRGVQRRKGVVERPGPVAGHGAAAAPAGEAVWAVEMGAMAPWDGAVGGKAKSEIREARTAEIRDHG